MRLGDTIIAAARGAGRSRRAVVRMSGGDVFTVLGAAVRGEDARAGARIFSLGAESAFPVLLAVFRSPRSYTGEDAAEIFVPGNPVLVERVVARLIEAGEGRARLAGPGEFTARAYFNGKLTLEQAEGVGAVIAAATNEELAAANVVLRGEAGEKFSEWSQRAIGLLALVEAGIDFTDQEDVVAIAPEVLCAKAAALCAEIGAFLGASGSREERRELPLVVLAGEPNAGKSTLFNALLGRARAVVSEVAGTTRDVLVDELDLSRELAGAGVVRLADAAGVNGAARGAIDASAQATARGMAAEADVVVHCDPSGVFAPMSAARGTVLRVRTKADLPHTGGEWSGESVAVCALDGWRLPALKRAIADAAWGTGRGGGAVVSRHRRALTAAAGALGEVAGGGRAPEIAAEALRAAVESLGELTGRVMPDDVLGRIFASFCVGK